MKKGSTAATKQSRNFSQQRLTIGLDLGDRSRVRMEGWRQRLTRPEKNLVHRKNKRTHLTPTGLLMEGVLASLRFMFAKIGVERYWDATPLNGDGLVCCVSKNRLAEHAG
jgi:hypothetical protein